MAEINQEEKLSLLSHLSEWFIIYQSFEISEIISLLYESRILLPFVMEITLHKVKMGEKAKEW